MTDGLSLRSTAWILSGLSIWALSLADFVSQRGKRIEKLTDEDPVELGLFIVGACALMWAAPLAQLAGARIKRKEGFKLVQFFAGGLPSILIQGFAWSCYATAVFCCVMALLNPSVNLRGLKTALGLLGLCAQALVNVSVDLFEPQLPVIEQGKDEATVAPQTPLKVKLEAEEPSQKVSYVKITVASVSFALSGIALAITLLADVGFFDDSAKPTVWNVAMGFFTFSVVSMTLTRFPRREDDPRKGDDVITVAQVFSFLMYCSALWMYLRLHATPSYASLKGTTVSLGIVGVFSAVLSMYAMLWRGSYASTSASSPKVMITHPPVAHRYSLVYRVSIFLLVLSLGLHYYHSSWAMMFSFLGAPMAHIGAWLVYRMDDGFKFAKTLQGGALFSIFQGVGWMAYALAVLGLFVFSQSSEIDLERWGHPSWDDAGGFLHPIVLIAHLALLWSKQVYRRVFFQRQQSEEDIRTSQRKLDLSLNEDDEPPNDVGSTKPEPTEGSSEDDGNDSRTKSDNQGEAPASNEEEPKRQTHRMRLAEIKELRQHRGQHWRRAGQRIALACTIFSVVLQVLLPEHSSISIIVSLVAAMILTANTAAPFSGPPPVVVQQALGWTLFVTSLAAQSVLFYNFKIWVEYDLIACIVRALGLVILLQGVQTPSHGRSSTAGARSVPDSPSVFSPRRRKQTEEDAGLDLRELDELIAKAKRPVVLKVLNDSRNRLLSDVRNRRIGGVLLGFGCIVLSHGVFFIGAVVDKNRHHQSALWLSPLFAAQITLGFICAFLIHAVLGKLLWSPYYQIYQPFRGGVHHVVLQAMGWPLVIISAIAQLIAMNYGIAKIELDGLLSGISLANYAGQIVLLASLAKFDERAPHLGFAFDLEGKELGWIFSVAALVLFLGVDVAIVRFGLQDTTLVAPVIVCAWIAVALSVPLAYMLERYESAPSSPGSEQPPPRRSRFGVLRVAALAIWTFSLFLALFLIGRAATLSSQASWLSSKTGFASVIAQGMMTISSEPARGVLLFQQILIIATTIGFLWVVMPFIRLILDGPMWYYAYFFKFWKHSLSPDGRHPLENALIHRNIRYGEDLMDVMVPLSVPSEQRKSSRSSSSTSSNDVGGDNAEHEEEEEMHPPVVYMHGGGHLFVKRELLSHSMTPLCRAGVVVYTVEYPLSPESRFPHAIVCVLQALKWIRKNHCRGGMCLSGGKPKICSECAALPEEKRESSPPVSPGDYYPCACCPHRRGASVVQLLGDSAGGNLAAMVTAILCNEHLRASVSPHSGYADFDEWKLPRVQRLGVIYGLLGRSLVEEAEEAEERAHENAQLRSTTSWLDWIKRKSGEVTINFVLAQYTGQSKALEGKVVLNDLEGQLTDFAPETLMLCGTSDPLVVTNRQALKLIREQTGRECKLIEYEGSIHSFHGMPVQWTFGRWEKDAYPATRELVKFFTGGAFIMPEVDFKGLPRDYSPLVVLPLTMVGIAMIIRVLMFVINHSVTLAFEG